MNDLLDDDDDDNLDYDSLIKELSSGISDEDKENIKTITNEGLCNIIIAYRSLGTFKEKSILCMEELATRRVNGSNFQFENYIESVLLTLPKFDLMAGNFKVNLTGLGLKGIKNFKL